MSAIKVSLKDKAAEPVMTPQPSSARKGQPLRLPEDCQIPYVQRLVRAGPKILEATGGRERDADGLVCVWDEHMGKTLYTAKIDSKEKIVTVFRESQQQQSMAQVASLVLDGREGMATEKALITLPTAQRGPVDKVFERGGFIIKGRSRTLQVGTRTYKWKTFSTHPELPNLGYYFDFLDEDKNVIASTKRLDESMDGHSMDEDADRYSLYLTEEARPILDVIVSTMLFLERLQSA